MNDLIYYALVGGLFVLNVRWAYKNRDKDSFVYRIVLFTRHKDWVYAFILILFIVTLGGLIEPYVPGFLRWGISSLFDKEGTNGNIAILEGVSKSAPVGAGITSLIIVKTVLVAIFLILMAIIPKMAYLEEKKFRYGTTKFNRETFFRNIRFGLLHCIVGVPVWIGLLISVAGMIFSFRYIKVYNKTRGYAITSQEYPHEMALASATSLHGKYNTILLAIVFITLIII